MARPTISMESRLRKLEAAQVRAEKIKSKARISAEPMAQLIGVRWNTLREWCNEVPGFEQSGAFNRGGNGIEWEFDAKATIAYLINYFRTRIAAEARKSKSLSAAIGVDIPDEETAMSMASTKDLVNLTVTVVAAAEKQKRYVLADEVASFLAGYNQAVLDGILGVRAQVDPNGNLPVQVRAKVDQCLRQVATSVHELASRYIEAKSAGLQQEGAG